MADDSEQLKQSGTKRRKILPEQSSSSHLIRLIVGGENFSTTYSTLVPACDYFSVQLAPRWLSDDVQDASQVELIIDRDPEPFAIILSFLRTGRLLLKARPNMLADVLIEADFYGVRGLLQHVQFKSYKNLNSANLEDLSEEYITELAVENFHSLDSILEHPFFPDMFFGPIQYHQLLSTCTPQPGQRVGFFNEHSGLNEYYPVVVMGTYERKCDKAVMVEPFVKVSLRLGPWTAFETPSLWAESASLKTTALNQIVPISFQMASNKKGRLCSGIGWWIETITTTVFPYSDSGHSFDYTAICEGRAVTRDASFIELTSSNRNTEVLVRGLGYSSDMKLVDVTKFSNFKHLGAHSDGDESE